MRRDAMALVKNCRACMKYGIKTGGFVPLVSRDYVNVWAELYVDLFEMPRSAAGYQWVLVCLCRFSKYVVCRPMKTSGAKEAASLMQGILYSYGVPAMIQADNGNEFKAEFVRMLEKMDVEFRASSLYHPRSNAAESAVKRVKRSLLTRLEGDTSVWEDELDGVVFVVNKTPVKPTMHVPFAVMFLRPARRPLVTRAGTVPQLTWASIEARQQAADVMVEAVRESREDTQAKMIADHTARGGKRQGPYAVGSYAYVERPRLAAKSVQKRDGPQKVVGHRRNDVHVLEVAEGKYQHRHESQLRPAPFLGSGEGQAKAVLTGKGEVVKVVDGEKLWGVRRLLDRRQDEHGVTWYQVDWDGKDANGQRWVPTWQPAEAIEDTGLIRELEVKLRRLEEKSRGARADQDRTSRKVTLER